MNTVNNRRKLTDKDLNRPRLRRAPGGNTVSVDDNGNEQKHKDDQDDRPTLKRRDHPFDGGPRLGQDRPALPGDATLPGLTTPVLIDDKSLPGWLDY